MHRNPLFAFFSTTGAVAIAYEKRTAFNVFGRRAALVGPDRLAAL